jgi:ATP-binding cassette, subfamily B, bacterial
MFCPENQTDGPQAARKRGVVYTQLRPSPSADRGTAAMTDRRSQRTTRRQAQLKRLASPRQQLKQLRYVPWVLRLIWSVSAPWMAATAVMLIIAGLLPVATVILTRDTVDALVHVVSGDSSAELRVISLGGMLVAALVLQEIMSAVQQYIRSNLAERVQDHMSTMIHQKVLTLDMFYFESPAYQDRLQRATTDAVTRPLGLLQTLTSLLQNTVTLVAMSGVLLSIAWWMPLLLVIGTAPALFVALRSAIETHRWRLRRTVDQRRLGYFQRMIVGETTMAEMRLFGLGPLFVERYRNLRRALRLESMQLLRRQSTGAALAGLSGLFSVGLGFAWLGRELFSGNASLGGLAMFWQTMNQGQRLTRQLLTGFGEIYQHLLFLDDLHMFLGLKPRLRDPEQPQPLPVPLRQGIRVEDVTFHYPGSKLQALKDLTLDIPAGKVVAIVGHNGAGKSTLIKLLCRFYDPREGSISWDGVDLRQVRQDELRSRISVLFQSPVPFAETVAESIAFGQPERNADQQRIEAAAAAGGFASVVQKLPQGFQTMLGRAFGTVNLSGGEWQRLALARSFLRDADLVILDEPTSAMDSWAEHEWMQRFRSLVSGRSALIITHRFTTAMRADIIYVFDDGRVIETGTHAELIALGGRYAQSWRQQIDDQAERERIMQPASA